MTTTRIDAAHEDVCRFATGAVRSKDADATRYDLITPVGLEALARFYGEYDPELEMSPEKATGEILGLVYKFLSGGGSVDDLTDAAIIIAELIADEDGEQREWVTRTHYVSPALPAPYERIPSSFLKAVAEAYAEGAVKYSAFNWEKGMDVSSILNHFLRHLLEWRAGDRTEPHLGHAGWNILAAIHSVTLWPELNASVLRQPGCKAPACILGGTPEKAPADAFPTEDELLAADSIPLKVTFEEFMAELDKIDRMAANLVLDLADNLVLDPTDDEPCDGRDKTHRIPAIADYHNKRSSPPVLYLSGPMTGIPAFNFPAFNRAADALRRKGYPVLNPADFGADPAISWSQCLERDLAMLGHAAILVQLPGWAESKGASLEFNVATALGKGVVALDEILDLP